MNQIYGHMSLLSRAIHYKNLTGASHHVGLSQPQLSRIIKKIENELDLVLLKRDSPRHTSWTPEARKLVDIFNHSQKMFESNLKDLVEESEQRKVSIACLEGLSFLAIKYAKEIFERTSVIEIHLDVYDLNKLEAKFIAMDIDMIFTSREPGAKKYEMEKTLGYQIFQETRDGHDIEVLSPFEYGRQNSSESSKDKTLVSNSLVIRKSFCEEYETLGRFPGPVQQGKIPKQGVPVKAVAQNHLSPKIWKVVEAMPLSRFK